jgi:hypothetical protein
MTDPILVVDLEATCDEHAPAFDMETARFGSRVMAQPLLTCQIGGRYAPARRLP